MGTEDFIPTTEINTNDYYWQQIETLPDKVQDSSYFREVFYKYILAK